MFLSILVPIYEEKENIRLMHANLAAVLPTLGRSYEIIFVNDGSADGSTELLDEVAAQDPNVVVIHLRRNYGQTAALMAGIHASSGEIIIPMDGDLQNDPADIPRLLAKMEEGFDVVSGWRKQREDNAATRRLPSIIANKLISKLFGVNLHDYGCTLKAYRRNVIEDVRLYGEMHRYIPIYASWEGARVTEIPVAHHARRFGHSKYGLGRIFRVMLDVTFLYFMDRALDRPIQFFGRMAGYSWVAATLMTAWALWMKFAHVRDLVQSPLPLVATTLFLAGVLFILMGLLAEMQMRIYFEAQGKTNYAVRSVRRAKREPAQQRDVDLVES